jgi:hypothetical protein
MGPMKPIKQKKVIKRNPVAKALGELGYVTKVKPSKKIYKRIKKKPLDEDQTGET